jgi:hypothetical protein
MNLPWFPKKKGIGRQINLAHTSFDRDTPEVEEAVLRAENGTHGPLKHMGLA